MTTAIKEPTQREVDFDLHGLVGIRLAGASPLDVAAVSRQLGPLRSTLDRDPDIVIGFVDRLETTSPVRYLGLDEAGFTEDAFVILRSKHKAPARVEIAFSQIGERTLITCERGLPAVPLLIPIMNLTMLAKGVLPLHASAFLYQDVGVVATGWSKGGKTEALLAFMTHGAQYVGDEWIYVPPDGARVYGIPEPIRLWSWQLQQLPHYESLVGRRARARLRAIDLVLAAERSARGRRSGPLSALPRIAALVRSQHFVDIAPERLFGRVGTQAVPFERLFLVMSSEAGEVTVEPIDPLEVADRMAFSLQHERLDLMTAYLKFRFAFPNDANPLIERAGELERELLESVLAGKRAYLVRHPYPVSIDALYDAMRPFC